MDEANACDWSAVRAAYEGGKGTLAEICTTFAVSASSLRRRRVAEGWTPRGAGVRPGGGRKSPAPVSAGRRRRDMVARLFEALEHQMRDIEHRLEQGGGGEISAADRERDARTLASLARTLEKLFELDSGAGGRRSEGEGTAHRDIEGLRLALAERIQRLAGGGPHG